MPFNTEIVTNVLSMAGYYVGLFFDCNEPKTGVLTYKEPTIDDTADGRNGGYKRGKISGWEGEYHERQIANTGLILMFEARSALVGTTFTHFGLFNSAKGGELNFYGELSEPLTISQEGYVPLIRAYELIIGMDTVINTDYSGCTTK